jgi:hypothetical protein
MSISALNPVIAAAIGGTRKPSSTANAAAPAETATASPPDAALTGSTKGQISSNVQTILLGCQECPAPTPMISVRQALFEQYDSDQNGSIDDTEWQHYLETGERALGSGEPIDFRDYDAATERNVIKLTSVSLDGITVHHDC